MKKDTVYSEALYLNESIINKLKQLSCNQLVLTKAELQSLSEKLHKFLIKKNHLDKYEAVFIKKALAKNSDYLGVISILQEMIPSLVYQVVKRFENGHLASVFSHDEMTALAHQKVLDVLAKYRKGKVDMKGLRSYFKTAFKNHCQKTYEAHNGTDIRGSIRTVGSDEAMNVAMNLNLYNPEKQYIINDAMKMIYSELKKADIAYNSNLKQYASSMNLQYQHFFEIVKGLISGNTAEETCQELKMTMPEYLRQKRLALQHLKKSMPELLKDLFSEFEDPIDHRIHAQTVEKRSRKACPENKTSMYLFTKETPVDKRKVQISLMACVKIVDKHGNLVTPPKASELTNTKQFELKTEVISKNKLIEIKNNFLKEGKSPEYLNQIESLSKEFYDHFQKQLLTFQKNRYKSAV